MPEPRILICGLNWIGDAIMSMPAIQEFRVKYPQAYIVQLVKPKLKPLWEMHDAINEVLVLEDGFQGMKKTVKQVKEKKFDMAYILPRSFRSAVIPFWAGIPQRKGPGGGYRRFMLTQVVRYPQDIEQKHQAYENIQVLVPEKKYFPLQKPRLSVSCDAVESITKMTEDIKRPRVAFLPGASRGIAKQWPEDHFIALGTMLVKAGMSVIVSGSAAESVKAGHIAEAIGPGAKNFCRDLSFQQWAALLQQCDGVVCNDSGGMHLASALEIPLVALYGTTDPRKTGPLTAAHKCRILQKSMIQSRKVKRESAIAQAALAAISPREVYAAVEQVLKKT